MQGSNMHDIQSQEVIERVDLTLALNQTEPFNSIVFYLLCRWIPSPALSLRIHSLKMMITKLDMVDHLTFFISLPLNIGGLRFQRCKKNMRTPSMKIESKTCKFQSDGDATFICLIRVVRVGRSLLTSTLKLTESYKRVGALPFAPTCL